MRYFRLFNALFKHSAKRYLENRGNTAGHVLFMTVNFLLQLYLIQIIFTHTQTIAGWKREEVFLIAGISQLFGTIFSLLFLRSINHLINEITEGNMDLILTKPFSSQFYYSFYLIRAFEVFNILAPLVLIWYSITNLSNNFSILQILILVIMLICGLLIFYSIYISIAAITFWVGRFSAFSSLYRIFTAPLAVPTDIYGKNVNNFLTFVFPLAFAITIPAKVLLGKLGFLYLGISVFLALVFIFASTRIWNTALKRYSSTGS